MLLRSVVLCKTCCYGSAILLDLILFLLLIYAYPLKFLLFSKLCKVLVYCDQGLWEGGSAGIYSHRRFILIFAFSTQILKVSACPRGPKTVLFRLAKFLLEALIVTHSFEHYMTSGHSVKIVKYLIHADELSNNKLDYYLMQNILQGKSNVCILNLFYYKLWKLTANEKNTDHTECPVVM